MKSPNMTYLKNIPTTTQLSELDNGWGTYTSSQWGFAINHPLDVKTELTQNGVNFLKLGQTQSRGTELFDGLSLLIYSAQLYNTNFEAFVQQEYQKVKNEPINESISELKEAKVSTFNGYSFTATGLGKSTTYFLRKGTDGYVKIIDMTVEPENETRDFHKTTAQMLNTFQITTSPTGDTYSGGSDKLSTAVREFAANDLNVPANTITFTSIEENEWSNGCLDLEQKGEMCTQVITPGFEVTVQANGIQRIYRTNADASLIKIKTVNNNFETKNKPGLF